MNYSISLILVLVGFNCFAQIQAVFSNSMFVFSHEEGENTITDTFYLNNHKYGFGFRNDTVKNEIKNPIAIIMDSDI